MSMIMFSDCEPNIRIELLNIITYYPFISEKEYTEVNKNIHPDIIDVVRDTQDEKTLVIQLSNIHKKIEIVFDTREMLFNSLKYLDDIKKMMPIYTSNRTLPKPNKEDKYRMSNGVVGA